MQLAGICFMGLEELQALDGCLGMVLDVRKSPLAGDHKADVGHEYLLVCIHVQALSRIVDGLVGHGRKIVCLKLMPFSEGGVTA